MAFAAVSSTASGIPEAAGVTYDVDATYGLKTFRCAPLHATMTPKGCAARWAEAQSAYGERQWEFDKCRSCPIGAAHAGKGVVYYSAWYRAPICPRCGSGSTRMIGNRRCVSDYNREREMAAGRNARGNKPVELLQRPLHRVEVLMDVDGEARRHVDPMSIGVAETIVQILRTQTSSAPISFARAGQRRRHEELGTEGASVVAASLGPWAITDRCCTGCGGRVLENAAAGCRCADCGLAGEGVVEKAGAVGQGVVDLFPSDQARLALMRYRHGLFATVGRSALIQWLCG